MHLIDQSINIHYFGVRCSAKLLRMAALQSLVNRANCAGKHSFVQQMEAVVYISFAETAISLFLLMIVRKDNKLAFVHFIVIVFLHLIVK